MVVYLAITYAIALGIAPLISICPVSLSHSAFNNLMETGARAASATSLAMMAYVTTETGLATMGHRGAGRGLPVDPPSRRLRQGQT